MNYVPFIYLLSGVEFYPEEDPTSIGGHLGRDCYTSTNGNVWGDEKDHFEDLRNAYNLDHDKQDGSF